MTIEQILDTEVIVSNGTEEETLETIKEKYSRQYIRRLHALKLEADVDRRATEMVSISHDENLDLDKVRDHFHLVLEDHLKKESRKIIQEKNALKSRLLKSELDTWLRSFIGDKRDREMLMTKYAVEENEAQLLNLQSLLNLRSGSSDRWLVTGLFQFGTMILLAAQSKTGKSMLANHLAISAVTGGKFLNKPTTQCNVLYIQNEENLSETGKRLWGNGLQNLEAFDKELYDELIQSDRLMVGKHLDIASDIDNIFDLVDKYEIRVLIVDTLSSSIRKQGYTEYSPELLAVLLEFQTRCQDRNIFGLLLHHTVKSDDNSTKSNAIKGVSGLSSIPRANDGIMKMFQKGTAVNDHRNPVITLMYTPRNDQPMEMEIGMVEGEALYWNWEVYKETSLSQETIDQFCQIIVALRDRFDVWKKEGEEQNHPIYGFTATELAKGLGLERSQIVKNLNRLLQTDAISMYTSNRRHIYHLFNDGSTWLDSVILDYDNQQEIKQRQDDLDRGVISDLLSCKNVDEINEVVAQLSEEERTRINSKLTKEEVVIISLIRFPYKYKIGDIVALDTKDDTNKYRVIERNFDSKKPKEAELDYCHLYTLVALDVTDDNEQPIILQNQRSTNLISVEEKFGGENDTKEISQETEEVSNEVEEKDDSDEVQSQIEPDTIVPESDDDVPFDLDDEYDLSDLEM